MIKLINNITQIIILLGCCAISIFILNATTSIIPLTEIPQNWHQYRCIGFDLAHSNDIQNNINTDYNFCVSETFRLKEQIENLIKIQHYENQKTLYQKV